MNPRVLELKKRISETLQHQCNLVEVEELPDGLTDYMQSCIAGAIEMIMRDVEVELRLAHQDGQKQMRERAAKVAEEIRQVGKSGDDIRNLEITK